MSDVSEVSRVFRSSFPRAEDTGFRTNTWRDQFKADSEVVEPLYPTMLHALAHAAKRDDSTGINLLADRPDAAAEFRSYRRIYHQARAMSGAFRDLGLQPGDRVLLVLPTSFDFIIAFFAAQLAGGIPVPAYPPATLERAEQALARLSHIVRSCTARLCITSRVIRPLLGGLVRGGVTDIRTAESMRGDAEPVRRSYGGADDAFIQYTSGSTDAPKGVLLSQRNVVSNVHAIGQALRLGRNDIGVSWLPLYHDMGLIGVLITGVYWGMPLTLMSPLAFLSDPLRWLWTISRTRATLSVGPNFAYPLCAKRARGVDLRGLDLSSWRIALNGAEPINLQSVRNFERAFVPYGFRRNAMLPVYGLAEASLAVAFPPLGNMVEHENVDRRELAAGRAMPSDDPDATCVVSVGEAVPGHEFHIVDEHGSGVADRVVGHVVVTGPSVMQGYYSDPQATSAVLDGDMLWTGDLGYSADNRLFITGRAKDLVIVRGRNYYSEDIERAVTRIEGVRGGGAVAFGVHDDDAETELVILVIETRAVADDVRATLAAAVSEVVTETFGLRVDEVVLADPGTIPKTPSGKARRHLCRQLYLEQRLTPQRTGKLGIARVFVRSGAGFLAATTRRLFNRRAPE